MSVQNAFTPWSIQASEALSDLTAGTGQIYKAVDAAGGVAPDKTAVGILQQLGGNAEHITIGTSGIMKYVAGAAVVIGAGVTVTTSGYFTTATSGGTIFGRALAAVGSGAVGTGIFNFATPTFSTNSNQVL